MRPEVGDTSITLPVTLDFKGGRSTRSKTVLWATIIIIVATILILVLFWLKSNKEFLLKLGITIGIAIVELRVFCIFFFKERYLKKIYEDLQASDGKLDYTELWKIFEIDAVHPHICYFKNGKKGIFVRMERGTITGKGEDASFYHYDDDLSRIFLGDLKKLLPERGIINDKTAEEKDNKSSTHCILPTKKRCLFV